MTNKIYKKIRQLLPLFIIHANASNDYIRSGIDVSKWQGKIDWQKVKNAGIQFALLRAGYGDTLSYPNQLDPTFEYNYSQCKRVGMPVGVYWYSYATTPEMARQEAKACIAALKGKQFEYPIYYDVEELRIFNTGKTNEIIKAFCDELEKAGYWVGIYIYKNAAESYLSDYTKSRYAIALAQYASACTYKSQYGIWQNSSTTKVNGINGNVDHDWCYVNYPKLIKDKGKNGYTAPTTDIRVETIADTDILSGTATASAPPVCACVKKGIQYTVEKQYTKDGQTFGKIKEKPENSSQCRWINMSKVKKV